MEINPVIVKLQADVAKYKSDMKDVVQINEKMGSAILAAAGKIEQAADKMIAAFGQAAASDKAAATAIAQAEAKKIEAVTASAKAAAAAAAAEKANAEKDKQASKEKVEAAKRTERAARDAAKAATKAATDEKKAQEAAAKAAKKAATDKEAAAKKAELAIRKGSEQTQASIRGIATTIAAAFSINELKNFADGFTRIQNALKVSGLEGQNLADVQGKLLNLSSAYGVSLEELARLYGGSSQAASDLGATQSQLVQLTEATAQSLKITGTNAVQAQGAILGLTQALAAGKLTAEEFNQINEGGLRPLLQVVANTEKYGGSVAKLRQAVVDGKVSSKEFFEAIMNGAKDLDEKASKATLTLSGAFEAINSRLTVYIGEADKANGASAAIAEGIRKLADNLDLVIPAIAAIGASMAGQYVVGMLAAKASTEGATVATLALRGALSALQTVGIAAVILGLGYLVTSQARAKSASDELSKSVSDQAKEIRELKEAKSDATKETDGLTSAERTALTATANLTGQANLLATAWGRVALEAKNAALEQAKARLTNAAGQQVEAQNRLSTLQRRQQFESGPSSYLNPLRLQQIAAGKDPDAELKGEIKQIQGTIKEAGENVAFFAKEYVKLQRQGVEDFRAAPTAATAATSAKPSSGGRSGPSASDVEGKFNSELSRLRMEELQARLSIVTDIEKRADIQHQILDEEYKQRLEEIKNNKDYTVAQKEAQEVALERLYDRGKSTEDNIDVNAGFLRRPVTIEKSEALEEQAKEAAELALRYEMDALEAQAGMAINRKDKLAVEQRILANLEAQETAQLEELIAQGKITDAAKARSELATMQGARQSNTEQRNESPLDQARRQVQETALNMNDAVENIQLNAIDKLVDGLGEASTRFVKLGGIAGDVLNSIISDMVRLIAKQALLGGGGGGGILGSIFGSITGARATGGSVVGGNPYLVGENGPEIFNPSSSGRIIPNNMIGASASSRGGGQTIVQNITVDARNSVNPDGFAKQILAVSGQQAQMASVQMGKTVMQNVPSRLSSYQRDGT